MKITLVLHPVFLIVSLTIGVISAPGIAHAQSLVQPLEAPPTDQPLMLLKPGDRINITVAGFPDLSGEQVIMDDGTIQLPMVGILVVGGLSSTQANAAITEALRPYVRRPQVALSLLSISPPRISVTGEVVRPGPRTLSPEDVQDGSVTLSHALILAGGITPNADLRNIIIRRAASTRDAGAPRSELQVNLWQAIQEGNLVADVPIYDGDEIYVPLAQMNQTDQQLILASTLAPDQITVQVAGEVHYPGQIEISPTADISDVVAAAGGPTDKADRNSIQLFRLSATGQLEQQIFEFGETSEPLRNGDLVVVDKSSTDDIVDTVGRLIPFLNPLVWLLR